MKVRFHYGEDRAIAIEQGYGIVAPLFVGAPASEKGASATRALVALIGGVVLRVRITYDK